MGFYNLNCIKFVNIDRNEDYYKAHKVEETIASHAFALLSLRLKFLCYRFSETHCTLQYIIIFYYSFVALHFNIPNNNDYIIEIKILVRTFLC